MKRILASALFAIAFLLVPAKPAEAQVPRHPHFAPFGCGGFCMGFLSRLHFHGPLVNYGPYSGYYPFEPYGPWTSDLRYNPPPSACGSCGHGSCNGGRCRPAWGHYAVSTLKNIFHRVNPLSHRCGGGLNLGNCGSGGKLSSLVSTVKGSCGKTPCACSTTAAAPACPVSQAPCTSAAPAVVIAAPSAEACPVNSAPIANTPVPATMPQPAPVEVISSATAPAAEAPKAMPAPTPPTPAAATPTPAVAPVAPKNPAPAPKEAAPIPEKK
jgi:hypothetical protein